MSAKEVKRKKMQLEARNRCDNLKKERGYTRKSVWVPAQFEHNLVEFINELNKMHEANMSNKRL